MPSTCLLDLSRELRSDTVSFIVVTGTRINWTERSVTVEQTVQTWPFYQASLLVLLGTFSPNVTATPAQGTPLPLHDQSVQSNIFLSMAASYSQESWIKLYFGGGEFSNMEKGLSSDWRDEKMWKNENGDEFWVRRLMEKKVKNNESFTREH